MQQDDSDESSDEDILDIKNIKIMNDEAD